MDSVFGRYFLWLWSDFVAFMVNTCNVVHTILSTFYKSVIGHRTKGKGQKRKCISLSQTLNNSPVYPWWIQMCSIIKTSASLQTKVFGISVAWYKKEMTKKQNRNTNNTCNCVRRNWHRFVLNDHITWLIREWKMAY